MMCAFCLYKKVIPKNGENEGGRQLVWKKYTYERLLGKSCIVQKIEGAKKGEKSGKKRLTNEDYGGNITKLSRETRVKTK